MDKLMYAACQTAMEVIKTQHPEGTQMVETAYVQVAELGFELFLDQHQVSHVGCFLIYICMDTAIKTYDNVPSPSTEDICACGK